MKASCELIADSLLSVWEDISVAVMIMEAWPTDAHTCLDWAENGLRLALEATTLTQGEFDRTQDLISDAHRAIQENLGDDDLDKAGDAVKELMFNKVVSCECGHLAPPVLPALILAKQKRQMENAAEQLDKLTFHQQWDKLLE